MYLILRSAAVVAFSIRRISASIFDEVCRPLFETKETIFLAVRLCVIQPRFRLRTFTMADDQGSLFIQQAVEIRLNRYVMTTVSQWATASRTYLMPP